MCRQTIGDIPELLSVQFGKYQKNDRHVLHDENSHSRDVRQQENV